MPQARRERARPYLLHPCSRLPQGGGLIGLRRAIVQQLTGASPGHSDAPELVLAAMPACRFRWGRNRS